VEIEKSSKIERENIPEKRITSPAYLAKVLQERGLAPRRAQGQHFLVDDNIQGKILRAAALEETDLVLDIGAGPGALALTMAEQTAGVIAIEQDGGLVELLRDQAARRGLERLHIVEGDVRRMDLAEICREHFGREEGREDEKPSKESPSVKIVANLPYYLTTPLLFQLLQGSLPIKLLVIMVQLEAARRMTAEAGQKDYGTLTLLCRYYANPQLLFKVPRGVFYPPPAVDSAVVLLDILPRPAVKVASEDLFWHIIKAAFQKRRKTILNALDGTLGQEKGKVFLGEMLKEAEIDPKRRGETLTLEEFAKLAEILYNYNIVLSRKKAVPCSLLVPPEAE